MMGGGANVSAVMSELEGYENKTDEQLIEYLKSTGYYTDDDISSMNRENLITTAIMERQKERGLNDQLAQSTELDLFEGWKKKKKGYEEADSKFRTKWEDFLKKHPDIDPVGNLGEALAAYANAYIDSEYIQGFINGTFMDDSGVVHLDTDHGMYKDEYKEGHHFKTGLTEVPVDDYPALLHKGERILTKEEAEAYNMISSNAVQQYFGRTNSLINDSSIYDSLSSYILNNLEDNISHNSSSSVLSTR
jgi:hypothetical protein